MTKAHKGYLIKVNLFGETSIEKDGHLIGWAKDPTDARRIIDDELTLDTNAPLGGGISDAMGPS